MSEPVDVSAQVQSLLVAGRAGEALGVAERWLQSAPGDPRACFLAGAARDAVGRVDEALAAFQRACELAPEQAQFHAARAGMLVRLGHVQEALEACRRARTLAPADPDLRVNEGLVLERLKRPADALECHQTALALAPGHAAATQQRGLLLARLGREDEAQRHAEAWCAAEPRSAQALFHRAELALMRHDYEAALEAHDAVLAEHPEHAGAWLDRGVALAALSRIAEAGEAMTRARHLDPRAVEQRLAGIAAPGFAARPSLDPRAICLWAAFMRLRRHDWGQFDQDTRSFLRFLDDGAAGEQPVTDPALSLALPCFPIPDALRSAHARRIGRELERAATPRLLRDPPRPVDDQVLRVGYLSAAFRDHIGGWMTLELLRHHDPARFHVTAYAIGPDDGSETRRQIASQADAFVDLTGLGDVDAAFRIIADEVQILVDLDGYTHGARPGILAYRPAPIQVLYLGYHATMGARFMDYVITDPFTSPPPQRSLWQECRVMLPHPALTLDPTPAQGRPPRREALGLPGEGVVLCAMHRPEKIEPRIFGAWMRVLLRVPGSVLWLQEVAPGARERLRVEARSRHVDPARLVFAALEPDRRRHVQRLQAASLFLDTLYYNAHTTVLDALAAGLPVVTCPGDGPYARLAGSLLHAAGLADLVAPSLDAHEDTAVALAGDPRAHTTFVRCIEAARHAAPVFAPQRQVAWLERAYQRMWRRHLAGEAPEEFSVDLD
jgi:tetratricopeptide (TPR) repeat protein